MGNARGYKKKPLRENPYDSRTVYYTTFGPTLHAHAKPSQGS